MSEQEYTVGMDVFYYSRSIHPTVLKVTKMTATQVTLENGERFTKYGVRIGDSQSIAPMYIEPVTEMRRQEFEQNRKAREQQEFRTKQKAAVLHWIQHDMTPDEIERLYRDFVNCGMPKVD